MVMDMTASPAQCLSEYRRLTLRPPASASEDVLVKARLLLAHPQQFMVACVSLAKMTSPVSHDRKQVAAMGWPKCKESCLALRSLSIEAAGR